MSLQRVPINNFRGGLNTRDSAFELQANESPDLLNVTLTDLVGLLQVRKGMTRFDTNCPGIIDHARMINLANQNPILMCSINGKVYSCDTAGTFTLRFTGTAATVWDFAQMADASSVDKVWMANGTDTPQKWDGTAGATSAWASFPNVAMNRLLVWKDKMVALWGNTVRVLLSKTGDPEATTGAYDFVDLRGDDDDLEANTDMNVLADRLFIFKRRSVWIMTDPSILTNRKLGEPGCFSRFQSDVCDGKLYFFNEQGLWSTGGVAVAYESGSINTLFPTRMTIANIARARVLATRDALPRLLITLPVDGVATNNLMIECIPNLNFRRIGGRRYLLLPAFMLHTFDASCLTNFKLSNTAQWGIYGGRASTGLLMQYFAGTTDAGTQVSAYWKSSWMSIQGEEPFERIRRFNAELSGDCVVDVFKDFGNVADFTAVMPSGASFNYIPNPSFETDPLGAAPALWGGSAAVVSNTWASDGVQSAEIAGVFSTFQASVLWPELVGATTGIFATVTGSKYTASVDYNIVAAISAAQFQLTINWLNAAGGTISSVNAATAGGASGTGTLTLANQVPPAGTVQGQINVGYLCNGVGGTADVFFDNVQLLNIPLYRFARVRPESRGRFHQVQFRTLAGGNPFQINEAELVVRGGKEH